MSASAQAGYGGIPHWHLVTLPVCTNGTNGTMNVTLTTVAECGGEEGSNMDVFIGLAIGLVSSVAINIGQNIQALGAKEPGANIKPCSSKKWVTGLSIFITGSIGNMVAMAFASATILVPLESSQFVTNVLFSKFVNKGKVSAMQWAGTWIAVLGTVTTCAFGPNDARCFSLEQLESFWFNPLWLLYVVLTFSGSAFGWLVYYRLQRQHKDGVGSQAVTDFALPALFAVSSALIGGAQMIVHSKALAEVFDMFFQGVITILDLATSWFFWVELLITASCGIFWAVQMNNAITLYDPLFIIPLLQASYITFGSTASGIFYQEFNTLADAQFGCLSASQPIFNTSIDCLEEGFSLDFNSTNATSVDDGGSFCWQPGNLIWLFYTSGIAMVVTGILLLAPPESLALILPCCGTPSRRSVELMLGQLDSDKPTLALGYQKHSSDVLYQPNGAPCLTAEQSREVLTGVRHSPNVRTAGSTAPSLGLSTISSDHAYATQASGYDADINRLLGQPVLGSGLPASSAI
mmetsp:Transcript_38437/g.101353  ORF Transcript_38437/g.101353 Transcript_38437/m.101353 type:complete len:520 (+) Transcript_38437:90-1649(+)